MSNPVPENLKAHTIKPGDGTLSKASKAARKRRNNVLNELAAASDDVKASESPADAVARAACAVAVGVMRALMNGDIPVRNGSDAAALLKACETWVARTEGITDPHPVDDWRTELGHLARNVVASQASITSTSRTSSENGYTPPGLNSLSENADGGGVP